MNLKACFLILLLGLLSAACLAQQDPQNAGVKIGDTVPPFFLATLEHTWQSSEHAFKGATLNVLWFCDISQNPTSCQVKRIDDRVKVYLVDVNPYLPLEERRKLYKAAAIDQTVLFDSKKYAAIAYQISDVPAWFLVDDNGVLIDYRAAGNFEEVSKAIDRILKK